MGTGMTTENKPSRIEYEIAANADVLADQVATWLTGLATASEGIFSVCLSGGSTPRKLYERLTSKPYRDEFPWSRTHFFWGDERFVPPDNAQSNYRMINSALLSKIPIQAANIHPVPTQKVSPEDAAQQYEHELRSFFDAFRRPQGESELFDVTLLGLGEEGHLASLFPGSDALREQTKWAVAVIGVKPEPRITLTYPALESSKNTAFLVAGEQKREVFDRFHRRDATLPAVHFCPIGTLRVFADQSAAGDHGWNERSQT
jgi:6-phosphogluconolactonase